MACSFGVFSWEEVAAVVLAALGDGGTNLMARGDNPLFTDFWGEFITEVVPKGLVASSFVGDTRLFLCVGVLGERFAKMWS